MQRNFWDSGDFKDAHLSKLVLPDGQSEKICNWYESKKHILFFSGNPGVGKSYLIAAIIHDLNEKKKEMMDKYQKELDKEKRLNLFRVYNTIFNFRYMHERELFGFVREMISDNFDYQWELQRICQTPFFFLDDLGSTQLTDFQLENLQHFLDARWTSGLPTVITSNLFLKNMRNVFHDRFISRIQDQRNTIIELDWIDKRQA